MKYTFATLAFAAASLANPVPEAAAAAPSSFKITNVVSGGSGCPQGSIDVNWSDNRVFPICTLSHHHHHHHHTSLTILPDFNKQFTARVGAKTDVVDSRKNCQINLKLEYEPGFSFSVYQADYAGWADLDDGVTGLVKATYYFSSYTDQVSLPTSLPLHLEDRKRQC
jgi:hypothetical protein